MRYDTTILFIVLASVILTKAYNQDTIQSTNDGYEEFQKEAQRKIDTREWEVPQYSTRQVDNSFIIESKMDGIRKSDITVQVHDNVVVVAAAHNEPEEKKFYHLTKNIPYIYDPVGNWNYADGIFTIIFKMKVHTTGSKKFNSKNIDFPTVSQHIDDKNIRYDDSNAEYNPGGEIEFLNPYGQKRNLHIPSRNSYNTENYQQKSGTGLDQNGRRNWTASYESQQQQYHLDKYGRRIPVVTSDSEHTEGIEMKQNNFRFKSDVEKHTLHRPNSDYEDRNAHTNIEDGKIYPELRHTTLTEPRPLSVDASKMLKEAVTTEHGAIDHTFHSKTTKTHDLTYPNVYDTIHTDERSFPTGSNIILNKDIRVEQGISGQPLYSGANIPSPTIAQHSSGDTSTQHSHPSQERKDNNFRTIQQRQGSGTGTVNGNPYSHSNWNGTFKTGQAQYYLNEKGETIPIDGRERKVITVRENSFHHSIHKDTVQRHEKSGVQAGSEVYPDVERVTSAPYQYPNGDHYKIQKTQDTQLH